MRHSVLAFNGLEVMNNLVEQRCVAFLYGHFNVKVMQTVHDVHSRLELCAREENGVVQRQTWGLSQIYNEVVLIFRDRGYHVFTELTEPIPVAPT